MKHMLLGSTALALALVLAISPVSAQQKGAGEEKAAPQATEKGKGSTEQGTKGSAQTQPKEQGAKGSAQTQPKDQGTKGTAQSQPKDQGTKGAAQTQPKEQGTKGSAQTQPKEQGTKGTAQTQPKEQGAKGAQTQPKEQGTKGTAQTQPKEQGTKGAQTQPKEQNKSSASRSEKSGDRVQLSEQQRTSVHQTVLKERDVNRVNQVNFSISSAHAFPSPCVWRLCQLRSFRSCRNTGATNISSPMTKSASSNRPPMRSSRLLRRPTGRRAAEIAPVPAC